MPVVEIASDGSLPSSEPGSVVGPVKPGAAASVPVGHARRATRSEMASRWRMSDLLRLAREAQLGVGDAVDRPCPRQVRPALAVDRVGLEVEELTVAAAADALGADRARLDGCWIDGLERGEGGA